MIPLTEQLAEAKREMAMRKNVYPRLVQEGRKGWTMPIARQRIETMEAIVETLERQVALEEASNDLFGRESKEV